MFIALLLFPWVCMCKEMGLKPRVLADDLLLVSDGNEACVFSNFVNGCDATHQYIQDMGAKAAPKKSFAFSTDNSKRKWLKQHFWIKLQSKIEVKLNFLFTSRSSESYDGAIGDKGNEVLTSKTKS